MTEKEPKIVEKNEVSKYQLSQRIKILLKMKLKSLESKTKNYVVFYCDVFIKRTKATVKRMTIPWPFTRWDWTTESSSRSQSWVGAFQH